MRDGFGLEYFGNEHDGLQSSRIWNSVDGLIFDEQLWIPLALRHVWKGRVELRNGIYTAMNEQSVCKRVLQHSVNGHHELIAVLPRCTCPCFDSSRNKPLEFDQLHL